MNHRGPCGCISSGDGAGILISTPDKFFKRGQVGLQAPKAGSGVACASRPGLVSRLNVYPENTVRATA
jgi:hypothetical protein